MKSWFHVRLVLALAFVLQGPVAAQADCFYAPSYWYGCCTPCYYYPCYSYACYPAPCYYYYPVYPTYYIVPTVTVSPVIVSQATEKPNVLPSSQPIQVARQAPVTGPVVSAPQVAAPTVPDRIEENLSVVRRKLLLKNRTAEDVPGLVYRANQTYQDQEYREALDLSWAAVKLDASEARAWYSKAVNERALGLTEDARASAERGAALERLGQKGTLASLTNLSTDHRQFLAEVLARVNTESAPQVVAKPAPIESVAAMTPRKR